MNNPFFSNRYLFKHLDPLPFRLTLSTRRSGAQSPCSEAQLNRLRKTFMNFIPPILIEGYLGSGGFADVFLASSRYCGETEFVLKILKNSLLVPHRRKDSSAEQEEMRIRDIKKRFTNESFIQWHLSQNMSRDIAGSVVRVYDHGEFDRKTGYRFILMERMGATLRQFMDDSAEHPLHPALLSYKAHLMERIAAAIDCVHREGIIHRDIKPENILFARTDTFTQTAAFSGGVMRWPLRPVLKLGDFGTVRWVRSYTDKYDGIIIGSPSYMSPEQILTPRELDQRTDIYSFGMVCHELLYGTYPKKFTRSSSKALLQIAMIRPSAPPAPEGYERLCEIIDRCLADIDTRYQSAGELLDDLREFCRSKGPKYQTGYMPAKAPAAMV